MEFLKVFRPMPTKRLQKIRGPRPLGLVYQGRRKVSVSVLILINDLKTDGAGRVTHDAVPQVLKNSDFLLCLSRFTDAGADHLKVYAYSQSMHVISRFTLFKLFRYLK